jgi:hypothetical protein
MPIRWTKTHRAKLSGVRHPQKSDPPVLFPDAASGWAWLRQRHDACVANGCTVTATPEFQAGLDTVLASFASEPLPTLETETELMRMVVSMQEGGDCYGLQSTIMPALIALWGSDPAFLGRLVGAVGSFAWLGLYSGMRSTLNLEPLEPNPHGHKALVRIAGGGTVELHFFAALRAWAFRASEADFLAARAAAAPLRAALLAADYRAQESATRISWAFSRDPSWAIGDAEAALAGTLEGFDGPRVLASLTDTTLALRFAREGRFGFVFPFLDTAHDLMESLGDDALAVLDTLHERARYLNSRQKREFQSVLKLARTAHPD